MSNYNHSIAGCQCEQRGQVNLLWSFHSVQICSVSQCCVFSFEKKTKIKNFGFILSPDCKKQSCQSCFIGRQSHWTREQRHKCHRLFSFAATVSLLCNLQTWTRSSYPAASLIGRRTKQTFPGEKCAADVKFVGPQYVIYNTGSSPLTQTLKEKGIQPYWHNIKKNTITLLLTLHLDDMKCFWLVIQRIAPSPYCTLPSLPFVKHTALYVG